MYFNHYSSPPQPHPQLPHAVGTAPIRAKSSKCISGNGFQQQALASQGQLFATSGCYASLAQKSFSITAALSKCRPLP